MRFAIAACCLFLVGLPTHAQSLPFSPELRGECPAGASPGPRYPAIKGPAHRVDLPLPSGSASPTLRLIAWREPCAGNSAHARLFLNLTTVSFGAKLVTLPRVTVVQDGRTLGSFRGLTTSGYPQDVFLIRPSADGAGNAPGSADTPTRFNGVRASVASANEFIPFRAMDALSLYFRPEGWPANEPDLRVDIPAAGVPGNAGILPEGLRGQWWNPARPGWGLTFTSNERETLFAAWLTYDDAGESTWFVMSNGESSPDGTISGPVYSPRGRPFTSNSPSGPQMGDPVGTFSFRFTDPERGEFTFDVNGVRRTEPIQRLRVTGSNNAVCVQDSGVWYDSGFNGWGVGMEGYLGSAACTTHLTFLTFDAAGKPAWYFAPLSPTGETITVTTYVPFPLTLRIPIQQGPLHRPTGPAYRLDSVAASSVGPVVGVARTPKHDNGAGLSLRIGDQERTLLIQQFRFDF